MPSPKKSALQTHSSKPRERSQCALRSQSCDSRHGTLVSAPALPAMATLPPAGIVTAPAVPPPEIAPPAPLPARPPRDGIPPSATCPPPPLALLEPPSASVAPAPASPASALDVPPVPALVLPAFAARFALSPCRELPHATLTESATAAYAAR